MKATTAATELAETTLAIDEIVRRLNTELSEPPKLVKVSYTQHHAAQMIADKMKAAFPDTEIIGGSTHEGLFTEAGTWGFGKPAIGAFAVCDDDADVGVAMEAVPQDADPAQVVGALTRAIDRAQAHADRMGELPDMIWMFIAPGLEETSVSAVEQTFGHGVNVVGMTIADNLLTGDWSMFDTNGVANAGIGVALFYTTEAVTHYIQSGFMPTGRTGVITKAEGRRLISIDGLPAREVFEDWLGQKCISETGQVDHTRTGLQSLAYRVGDTRMSNGAVIEDYSLLAPISSGGQDLTMAATPIEGETIYLMRGEAGSVNNRLDKVTQQTLRISSERGDVAGGLVVMCAGYHLAMQDDALTSIRSLIETFNGVPIMGTIGYGEQGTFPNGKCVHGNWMVSSTIFNV